MGSKSSKRSKSSKDRKGSRGSRAADVVRQQLREQCASRRSSSEAHLVICRCLKQPLLQLESKAGRKAYRSQHTQRVCTAPNQHRMRICVSVCSPTSGSYVLPDAATALEQAKRPR